MAVVNRFGADLGAQAIIAALGDGTLTTAQQLAGRASQR